MTVAELQFSAQLSIIQLMVSQVALQLRIQGGMILSKLDDLQAAIATENVEISHLTDAVTAEEATVASAIAVLKAQAGGTPDAALDPVIASLTDHANALRAISTGLAAFNPNPA